jgi:hypothetical protein
MTTRIRFAMATGEATGLRGNETCERRIKVITDIDDCVKSSGGVKLFGIALGGIDRQYDRGQFYPGLVLPPLAH